MVLLKYKQPSNVGNGNSIGDYFKNNIGITKLQVENIKVIKDTNAELQRVLHR